MRLQRVPPTEKSGRVHSSSVTVAVVNGAAKVARYDRSPAAFEIEWFSGTGCGGQHRNKHQNSIKLRHIETNLVRTAQTRSRENSKRLAMEEMMKALDELEGSKAANDVNATRKSQIGSGARGDDRRRTFRFQDGQVIDNVSGKTARTTDIMKGKIDLLWPA